MQAISQRASRLTTSEASLDCKKGLGRLSALYFGVVWSFLNKDLVTGSEEVKDDFKRPKMGKRHICGHVK